MNEMVQNPPPVAGTRATRQRAAREAAATPGAAGLYWTVTSSKLEGQRPVCRLRSPLGFAQEDNGIYRFLPPMHRFLDVCLAVQQDRDLAAVLHSDLPLPTPSLNEEPEEEPIISLADDSADDEEAALAHAIAEEQEVQA